jgi:hypothetical protein
MSERHDREIGDGLIDDVARQMTAGQLSSDFRARVIASLDRRPRLVLVWRPMWVVAPLGAIATVVLAFAVARPFQGRDREAAASAPRQSSQAAKPETATIPPEPETATVRLPPSPQSGFGGTRKPDTTYERPGAAGAVAALAPPRLEVMAIGVEAIGVEMLPTDSIPVKQLDAIAPISIDPLPTDDARPPSGDQRPSPNDNDK